MSLGQGDMAALPSSGAVVGNVWGHPHQVCQAWHPLGPDCQARSLLLHGLLQARSCPP